jgi:hypothetical protein
MVPSMWFLPLATIYVWLGGARYNGYGCYGGGRFWLTVQSVRAHLDGSRLLVLLCGGVVLCRSLQVSAGKLTLFLAVGGAESGCAVDAKALHLYHKRSRRARSSEQQSVASVSLKAHVCAPCVVQLLLQFHPGQICAIRAVGCFVVCVSIVCLQ